MRLRCTSLATVNWLELAATSLRFVLLYTCIRIAVYIDASSLYFLLGLPVSPLFQKGVRVEFAEVKLRLHVLYGSDLLL